MNVMMNGAARLVLPADFTEEERAQLLPVLEPTVRVEAPFDHEAWDRAQREKEQARADRAALAAMDVVEDLSIAESDDLEFSDLMEFLGMHVAKVTRARIASGWECTPIESDALDRVADYADHIKQWRDERTTRLTFAALDELAKAARHAATMVRHDEALLQAELARR
jgi:hypothetical protein